MLSFAWWKDGRRHRKPLILAACLQGACNEWGFGAGGTGVILAVSVRAPPAVCRAAEWRPWGSSCCEGAGAAHGSGTPAGKGVGSWPEGPRAPVLGVTLAEDALCEWGRCHQPAGAGCGPAPCGGPCPALPAPTSPGTGTETPGQEARWPGAGWRCWGHSWGTRCLAGRREHPFCCQARFPALGNPDRLLLVLGSFCRAAASEEPMGDNKNHHPRQCMPHSRVEAPSPPKPVLTLG